MLASLIGAAILTSDASLRPDRCDVRRPLSYDHDDIAARTIPWSIILLVPEWEYYVYFYSLSCGHCLSIKEIVLGYAFCGETPVYFVAQSDEIVFGDDVESTIGADDISEIFIAGYPSLLEIANGAIAMNVAGSAAVADVLS